MSEQNFMKNHLIVVEIFLSGPKSTADSIVPKVMLLAWIKIQKLARGWQEGGVRIKVLGNSISSGFIIT